MTGFVLNRTGYVLNVTEFVLNVTGFFLRINGFVLNMNEFVKSNFNSSAQICSALGFMLIDLIWGEVSTGRVY